MAQRSKRTITHRQHLHEKPPLDTSESGFALMTTIWTVAIISAISLGILALARTYAVDVTLNERNARLEAAADAGLFLTIDALMRDDARRSRSTVAADGSVQTSAFDGAVLHISVQDVGGRIDLNTARPELLTALFEGLGAPTKTATRISDQILDWRDADHRPTGSGGEGTAYEAAGLDFGPKNAPFASLREIAQIIDFEVRWLPALEELTTVHSGLAGIDPGRASPTLLALLGYSDTASLNELSEQGNRLFFTSSNGGAFIIRSQASLDRSVFMRQAVIRLNPTGAPPYDVLEWRRGRAIIMAEELQ